MAIEIVDFPSKHGDFLSFFVCLPEGMIHPAAVVISWQLAIPRFMLDESHRKAVASLTT